MAILWLGFSFLVFLCLDVWNIRRGKKVKNKARSRMFMVIEGVIAVGCIVGWWIVGKF